MALCTVYLWKWGSSSWVVVMAKQTEMGEFTLRRSISCNFKCLPLTPQTLLHSFHSLWVCRLFIFGLLSFAIFHSHIEIVLIIINQYHRFVGKYLVNRRSSSSYSSRSCLLCVDNIMERVLHIFDNTLSQKKRRNRISKWSNSLYLSLSIFSKWLLK